MNKAHEHPASDEIGLGSDDLLEQGAVRVRRRSRLRVVTGDDVIGEQADPVEVLTRGKELKGPDPDMARGDADEGRPR